MTIVHRAGKLHLNADAVSRRDYPALPASQELDGDEFFPLIGQEFPVTPTVSKTAKVVAVRTPKVPCQKFQDAATAVSQSVNSLFTPIPINRVTSLLEVEIGNWCILFFV